MEKKTIHLRDQSEKWHTFEYVVLDELEEALKQFAFVRGKNFIIGSNFKAGYNFKAGDDITLLTGFFISGSEWPVTYAGNEMLSIGCSQMSINDWLEKGESIADDKGWSKAKKDEYRNYVSMAQMFHNQNYAKKETT
jgi:hypothetical protein